MSVSTELRLNGSKFGIRKLSIVDYQKMLKDKEVTLPIFQRGKVWTANDMLALLVTIKNGEPMPTIVIAEVAGKYYLLDGQQRTHSFQILKNKFTGPESFKKTVEAINKYEIAVMEVSFSELSKANELYNRLNAKSGLTVGQKTKGQVHDSFRSLYNFIQGHNVIRTAYTKNTKGKIADSEESIEAIVEKTEDITNALTIATVMPSYWSTQTTSLAKLLGADWKHEKLIEEYYDTVDRRLSVVESVIALRTDIANRIRSNRAVFIACYLLADSFEAEVISQALRKVFDGNNVVNIQREIVVEDTGKGPNRQVVKAVELFGSGSSNDNVSSRKKEGLLRKLCEEVKIELAGKESNGGVTPEELARIQGLA